MIVFWGVIALNVLTEFYGGQFGHKVMVEVSMEFIWTLKCIEKYFLHFCILDLFPNCDWFLNAEFVQIYH